MNYLGNAFSLQMLDTSRSWNVSVEPVRVQDIPADVMNCIGHPDTAHVVGGLLGRSLEANRVSVKLTAGDTLYVAQIVGGRLPEGTTTLPEGFEMVFLKVTVR